MSRTERERWERRYASGEVRAPGQPSPFLEAWLERLPRGRALDVACGAGRNALRLAEAGYDAEAIDISSTAIERARAEAERRGLRVRWRVADLDSAELPTRAYRLITVFRYVAPGLWPRLAAALAPDGWVVIENHLQTRAAVAGPRSPAFRVRPGELLEAFRGARILLYRETLEAAAPEGGAPLALARLVACVGDPGF